MDAEEASVQGPRRAGASGPGRRVSLSIHVRGMSPLQMNGINSGTVHPKGAGTSLLDVFDPQSPATQWRGHQLVVCAVSYQPLENDGFL